MKTYHYPTEAHMRAAHPQIAFLLSNIGEVKDGVFQAQLQDSIYTWDA